MFCLTVLYPEPDDRQAFRDYYIERHLPLARTLPGLIRSTYAFPEQMGPVAAPFCIFQAWFPDAETMGASLQSEIGAKVAADVPNYSPKGAAICSFPVEP